MGGLVVVIYGKEESWVGGLKFVFYFFISTENRSGQLFPEQL